MPHQLSIPIPFVRRRPFRAISVGPTFSWRLGAWFAGRQMGRFPGKNATSRKTVRERESRSPSWVAQSRKRLSEQYITNETDELLEIGIGLAKNGDRQLVKFFLERLIPREQPVKLTLRPIKNHRDVALANARIITAVSAGEILPSAAAALTAMVANIDKTLSDAEFEEAILAGRIGLIRWREQTGAAL